MGHGTFDGLYRLLFGRFSARLALIVVALRSRTSSGNETGITLNV